jgi:two-component system, OmpR family, sensor histidine kinase QseC
MSAFIHALWRPSLVRRVVLALLVAFTLVWAVLVVADYWDFKGSIEGREAQRLAVRALAASLDGADPAQAVQLVRGTETQYNLLRQASQPLPRGKLLFQLARLDGTVVYASQGLGGAGLTAVDATKDTWTLNDQNYWMASQETPLWRVTLLEPTLSDGEVLKLISRNLVQSLLIAFPLVLLPLWLAVRRGLRPLRELVGRVAERSQADFSPLALDLRYAELQPLETAFNDLLAHARHSVQSERGFVQDAAHELRTPLAVMAAQAHVLVSTREPALQQTARVELERAIQRASHLVHQLLTLARLESQPPQTCQTMDLVEWSQELLARAQPAALARGIDLGMESPEALVVTVDVQLLQSVVDNLVNNALAYVNNGARVTVSLAESGDDVTLCVADDGPGIPVEERARLMGRFQRGRELAEVGSGLGLPIATQAAEQLGGRLQMVEGLSGRGIGFGLRWPKRTGT